MNIFDTLLPRPRAVITADGGFTLDRDTTLWFDPGFAPADSDQLVRSFDYLPFRLTPGSPGDIRFHRDGSIPEEGYRLQVSPTQVNVTAATVVGARYALETLRQLFGVAGFQSRPSDAALWYAPSCSIEDAPALRWRGVLLDVARHFFPIHQLFRFVDLMVVHRLNRLQLHLTDDQGWRFESKTHPRLHTFGGVRDQSQISHAHDELVCDGTPHGGYYTQDQLRQLVDYARDRGVTVVPEIEIPGHASAFVAAYPDLGFGAGDIKGPRPEWGIHRALMSPLPDTFTHLTDILDEVIDVFDSSYIHLGGDEADLGAWSDAPEVQAYMEEHGVATVRELFIDFFGRICAWLSERGRNPVAWDDSFALDPERAGDFIVMAWRGEGIARRAAEMGRQVIMTPVLPTYFDYYQSTSSDEPMGLHGPITLEDVANFTPVPVDWPESLHQQVIGAQCQIWTELIDSERRLDYMAFPRLSLFADAVWQGGSLDGFWESRLRGHLIRLDAFGVEYRPLEGPHPWQAGGTGLRSFVSPYSTSDLSSGLADLAEHGRHAEARLP